MVNASPSTILLKETEVAKLLSVGRRTLAQWRKENRGPKWVDLSGGKGRKATIRYRMSDLETWLENNVKEVSNA